MDQHQQSNGAAPALPSPLDRTEHTRNTSYDASSNNLPTPPTTNLKEQRIDDAVEEEEDKDEVPRIISYPDIIQKFTKSSRKTFTSDISDVSQREGEALIGKNKGKAETVASNDDSASQSKNYGGTAIDVNDDNAINDTTEHTSHLASRRISRRTTTSSSRNNDENNSLTSSFRSLSESIFSPGGGRTRSRSYSIVHAPDDGPLPPETHLLGSSKLAANAINIELRRSIGGGTGHSTRDLLRNISWAGEGGDGADDDFTTSSVRTAKTLKEIEEEYLEKTRTTFMNDAMTFAEGTIPQSIMVALCVGCVCGCVAYLYYTVLDYLLELIWDTLPERFVEPYWPEHLHVLWIPLVSILLSVCCGLSIYYLGEPGDLAYTIKCVHEKGYKGTHHIIPMVASSLFSILAGASLGPEAPLVAICAATAGFLSRKVFKQTNRNVVRKHTFMGMAGALSAFFGVPLGGSLFALEVTSRFGVEYFEHLIEAIFAGEICVAVFRGIAGLPLGQIWTIAPDKLNQSEPYMIVVGAAIGLLAAGVAVTFANFHWRLMEIFQMLGLIDDENIYALPRALVGAVGVVAIGMLVPQTMFWGEFEFPVIATMSPASQLPHVWPTTGLTGFEMDTCLDCLIVGFAKLMAISFTVAGGFRGGFIFPFFSAGAAFGRALCFVFPKMSPSVATLCFAAGINVAITRTALATSLILSYLSGEQFALPAILAASVVSLFATGYVPFIKSQLARSDIDFSMYYRKNRPQPRISESIHHKP